MSAKLRLVGIAILGVVTLRAWPDSSGQDSLYPADVETVFAHSVSQSNPPALATDSSGLVLDSAGGRSLAVRSAAVESQVNFKAHGVSGDYEVTANIDHPELAHLAASASEEFRSVATGERRWEYPWITAEPCCTEIHIEAVRVTFPSSAETPVTIEFQWTGDGAPQAAQIEHWFYHEGSWMSEQRLTESTQDPES